MKRDMDLVRDLLLQIEKFDQGYGGDIEIETGDHEPQVVAEHLRLLLEARLIEGDAVPDDEYAFDHILPTRLTWSGHDFLETVRDPEIWKKTKEGALSARGFTLDLMQDLAKGFIKKQIEERTGIAL
ncbi:MULTISPECIES: DUF2513 domain-containing protein [Agrobacterium tumefaciens complex]|uniref:DUF2513 domain-containing protein n=1 Tax=Agrobacterium TaxID=357 RepID=UPI000B4064CE|nr:DUF2513 domain-containing protein [Agrobacterium tumefaciens]MBP2573505.1 hypothetical protein [Agrobacterium tumefaciens]MDP9790834.1 hypothetical protein [Agrobacterium tumefaciens]NSY04611.1 DUF2513 domain-containing protein [Agrobacterium tumefaciens]OVE86684.1 hypothetical protein B7W89_25590 [Agrobacterium tumefaciens]TCV48650.1 uncharacterized protein DUF2513 [Agrobacterium tumefaciens]